MIEGLRARNEWRFFGVLPRAGRTLAAAWWVVLVLRGTLPAVFAIVIGTLVGAVQLPGDLLDGDVAGRAFDGRAGRQHFALAGRFEVAVVLLVD